MKKDRQVSLRVSGVVVDFIKGKLQLDTDYEVIDVVLRMYYDYYNPLDSSFMVGVPKIRESDKNKSKDQSGQRKSKDKVDISTVGDKKDGGEVEAVVVTKMYGNKAVKGRYDEKGLFKRL